MTYLESPLVTGAGDLWTDATTAAFLDAVRTGNGGGCNIEDAFSVQRFIDAVYASSETGGSPVELRETL